MKTKEIIKTLNKANTWRRGGKGEMPDPKEFGFAINEAINRLKQYEQMIDSMKQTKEALLRKIENQDEILNSACSELQFANLQKDFFKSILDEVEVLLNKNVNNNLIKAIIENSRIRANLDIIINYDIKVGINNSKLSS